MPDFTLMDKVLDPKKFTFEEAARIATVENWRSYFGLGFAEEEWNEVFYLMVKGDSVTPDEFKKEGKKSRIFINIVDRLLVDTNFELENNKNKSFCIALQRKLATANIKKVLENHRYIQEGLLILGVALRYVAGVEQHNKILTINWIPKFYNFFKDKTGQVLPPVKRYYHELQVNGRFLTCDDLDILNNQNWFENR